MGMTGWPSVHGEFETIAKVKDGHSLSRIGDGEFKVMDGGSTTRQAFSDALGKEMRRICTEPSEKCLVGIPTMDPKGSKYSKIEPTTGMQVGWLRQIPRFSRFLSAKMEYWSALISRPDCGEWMMNKEYAELYQSMWLGRKVCVIGPPGNKIYKTVQLTQEAVSIDCLVTQAYAEIDHYEKQALASGCDLILISGGMMATCLAHRLSPKVQAVDVGSIGGFLLHMLLPGKDKIMLERTDDYNKWVASA